MTEDVKIWLEEIGLGQYSAAFEKNAIDWELLTDVDQETLKDIGIKAAGHRLRILKAIATLRVAAKPLDNNPVSSSEGGHDLTAWSRTPGERKPVTMLFADITGSTALTEKLDAEEAHDLLYGATQRMCEAVERNRGTVCRFMGDGLMAMFGAPVASEQHALDACEAALDMQNAIRDYALNTDSRELRIRVGLNSGEVVVLTVGEGDKVEYDASGPTVPIAARMEQAARPGEVFLTAATLSLATGRVEVDSLGAVPVKGISEPISAFALRRVKLAGEVSMDSGHMPLVGRQAELKQFRGMLDACIADGQGETLYVHGEPGVGKSRLIEEFMTIAADKGASIHRGLVLPFGVEKGPDAIRALARSLLEVPLRGDESLTRRAADTALADGRIESDQAVFLNDLLDLSQSPELLALYDAMDNAKRNEGKQDVVSRLLTTAGNVRPVLAVVENMHWANDITLAHIAALSNAVKQCPALLVVTSRVDDDLLGQSWRMRTGGRSFLTLDLQPLGRCESIALVSQFLDASDPVVEGCIERAAGNPLFLEQLARTAMDGMTTSLPDSIQSLIVARMDRLGPEHKQALQAASVLGLRFDIDILRHLTGRQGYNCNELMKRNLVRAEGAAYLFTHALIQEGVYHSLLKRTCRELHAKAAQWFSVNDTTLYAHHLDKASDERAPRAYLDAARGQVRQYRYEAALSLVELGLHLDSGQADRHELTCFKAELLLDLGHVASSLAVYEHANECAEGDEQRLDAWMGLASCLRVTSDYARALELLSKCETLAARHKLTRILSRITHLRGNLYFPLGNIAGCREEHQRALEYARDAKSAEDEARALGGLGDAEYGRGRMRSAYNALRMCVEQCRVHGFGRIEVANLSLIGNSRLFIGDCEQALRDSSTAALTASRVSHDRAEMSALVGVCNAAFELGDSRRLDAEAQRGLSLSRKLNARIFESVWRAFSSAVYYVDGDMKRAREALEPAIRDRSAHTFVGAKVFGQLAMISQDPATRTQALREGERLLGEGTIGVSTLFFYRFAMEACLHAKNWPDVKRYAQALEDFTSAEPLPWSEFFIARGRVLAEFGSGNRDEETVAQLRRLSADAQRRGLKIAIPALAEALSAI